MFHPKQEVQAFAEDTSGDIQNRCAQIEHKIWIRGSWNAGWRPTQNAFVEDEDFVSLLVHKDHLCNNFFTVLCFSWTLSVSIPNGISNLHLCSDSYSRLQKACSRAIDIVEDCSGGDSPVRWTKGWEMLHSESWIPYSISVQV